MSENWNLEQYQDDPVFWMHVCVAKFRSEIALAMESDSGLTQRELGERLGLSEARVSKLLHGSPNLTVKTMCQLAAALGKALEVHIVERACLAELEPIHCSSFATVSEVKFIQRSDSKTADFKELPASEFVEVSGPTFTRSGEPSDFKMADERKLGRREIAA